MVAVKTFGVPLSMACIFAGVASLDFLIGRALGLRNIPVPKLTPGWQLDLIWVEAPYQVSALFLILVIGCLLFLRFWNMRIKLFLIFLILSMHIFSITTGTFESTDIIVPAFLFFTALDLLIGERLNASVLVFAILLLWAFMVLSIVNGQLPATVRLLKETKYLSMFFLVLFSLRTLETLRFATKVFLVLACLSAVIGIIQEALFLSSGFLLVGNIPEENRGIFFFEPTDFGVMFRAQAFFGVPGTFAAVMAVAAAMIVHLLAAKGHHLFAHRLPLYPVLALLLTALSLTFARPAYAACALGAVLAIYLARPSRALHFTGLLALLLAMGLGVSVASPRLWEKGVDKVFEEVRAGDFMGRLTLNRRGLEGTFTKHPIAGAGLGRSFRYTEDYRGWPPHSVLIQAAADIGLFGALAYLAVFVLAFVRLVPVMGSTNAELRLLARMFCVGFVALFSHMINEPFFIRYPLGWIYLGLMESLNILARREEPPGKDRTWKSAA